MILKLTGCILVMISGIGIGVTAGNERRKFLKTLTQINNVAFLIQGDIRYSHTPIIEALSNAAKRHNGDLKKYLSKVSERLFNMEGITFEEIWKEETEWYIKNCKLDKRLNDVLLNLGKCLDSSDIDMKTSALEGFIRKEEKEMYRLKESENEKVRLYRNLGILGGLFVIVLLF